MSTDAKIFWGSKLISPSADQRIDIFTGELVPFLVRIISPTQLKSVNVQLMKPDEKKLVKGVVDCMVGTGLQYVQAKSLDDGQYVYKLNHPINELLKFSTFDQAVGKKAIVRKSENIKITMLPYGMRQMLSHEVEKERLNRSEMAQESRQKRLFGIFSQELPRKELKPRIVKDLTVKPVVVKVFLV